MTPHQMVCVVRWEWSTLGRVGGAASTWQSFVAQCGKSGPFQTSAIHHRTYGYRADAERFFNVGGER